MEKLLVPEVMAGLCLALYFFVRGFATLFKNGHSKNGNGATLNSLAQDHVMQTQAAREESIVSRQEFLEHQRELQIIREKIESWDDAIHHGDFSCKWTRDEIVRLIDSLARIEQILNERK